MSELWTCTWRMLATNHTMGLRWDPREDPAVLWTWLVAVITALEFLMETTLLNRQLKLSRAKGVPTVLRDIAPEAFITSAERFRITHATRFIYAAFRTAFVFFFVLDGGLSALWNRAGAFVEGNAPNAQLFQSVAWVALLTLICALPKFVAYFNLMLLYQKGMVEKPKPFVNYIFDIKTMLAIGWLTLLAYSSESLQNDLSIEDSTGAGSVAIFFTGVYYTFGSGFPHDWFASHTKRRLHASAATDLDDLDLPLRIPAEDMETLAQLSPAEAKAVRKHDTQSRWKGLVSSCTFMGYSFGITGYLWLVYQDPTLFRAFGFGTAEEGADGVIEHPPVLVGIFLGLLLLRPVRIFSILTRHVVFQKLEIKKDAYVSSLCLPSDFARTLEANEEEDQPVTDWIDYDSGDAAAISGAQKRHFVQALVKLYLVCNVPLFSDPLYNAYYQKRPALADRLAVLGPVDMELGLDDKVDTPYLDESDSDIAVPSIMLLP